MSYAHGCVDGSRQAYHDIRQPIAGVHALAEAALSEADLPDIARDCLNQIVGFAEWQSDVIEHWLWAPDARPPRTRWTDVLGVVSETVAAQRVRWAANLALLWPSESVLVGLPKITMRRTAATLLANATCVAGPSGRVAIEISPTVTPEAGGRIADAVGAM